MDEATLAATLLGTSPKHLSKKNLLQMGELNGSEKISTLTRADSVSPVAGGAHTPLQTVPAPSRRYSMWSRKTDRAEDDNKTENDEGGSGKLGFLSRMSSTVMGGNSGKVHHDDDSTHGGHSSYGDSRKKGGRFGWFGFGHSVREEDSDVSSIPGVASLPGIEVKRGEIEVRKLRRYKRRGLGEEFWKQRQERWKDLPLPDLLPSIVNEDDKRANAHLEEDPIVRKVQNFLENGHTESAARDFLLRLLIQEDIKATDAHKYSLVTLSGVRKVPPAKPQAPPVSNMVIAEAMAVAGSTVLDMDDKHNVSRISVGDCVSATICFPEGTTVVAVNTVTGTVTLSTAATTSRVLKIKFITPMKAHPINNNAFTSNGTTSAPQPEI